MRSRYVREVIGAVWAALLGSGAAVVVGAGLTSAQTPGVGLLTVEDYPLSSPFAPDRSLSFDASTGRMYISDQSQGVVRVFDTQARGFVGSIAGLPGSDQVLSVPEEHAVYATMLSDNAVIVIDPDTLSAVETIATDGPPGGLVYAPSARKLYATNRRGPTLTAIDIESQTVASVDLGVAASSPVLDAASGTILVLLPSQDQVATIDPNTNAVVAVHDVHGCTAPTAIVVDNVHHLAFVGCQANTQFVELDLDDMQVVAVQSLAQPPKTLAFEPQLGMVYVATEQGVVYVFREDPLHRGNLQLVTNPVIGPNAQSLALDTSTRHLYVPTLDIRNTPVLREVVLRALPEPE